MEDTSAKAVIDLVERLDETEELAIGGGDGEPSTDLLVVGAGKKVIDLLPMHEARRERPLRRKGQSVHTTLASFVDHVARHRDSQSAIFAVDTIDAPSLLAIYDYNEATIVDILDSDKPAARTGTPRFGQHRAFYSMPLSDEWKAWQRIAGASSQWLSQREFAEALEDRAIEILAPSDVPSKTKDEAAKLGIEPAGPSTMLSLARGLFVNAERKLGSAQNLSTGESKLVFEETHTTTDSAGTKVTVPSGIVIAIPVFRDDLAYPMIARVRYKAEGPNTKWKLSLHRSDVAFRDAFYEVAKTVKQKTGLPLFYGTPET
jgi:hypothetical protein